MHESLVLLIAAVLLQALVSVPFAFCLSRIKSVVVPRQVGQIE